MVVGILRTLIDVPKAALHTFFKVGSKVCPRVGTPAHVSFVKVVVASEVKQVLASCSRRDRTGEGLRGNRVLRDRSFFSITLKNTTGRIHFELDKSSAKRKPSGYYSDSAVIVFYF